MKSEHNSVVHDLVRFLYNSCVFCIIRCGKRLMIWLCGRPVICIDWRIPFLQARRAH